MIGKFEHIIKLLPYFRLARLHRPLPMLLLLWPCFMGLAISNGSWLDYLIFLIGAAATRSAGCVINDMVDQSFDRYVERTKTRPLAAKTLNTRQALGAVVFFLSISFGIWLCLNQMAKYLSLFGILLMVVYPYTKRLTNWPQLFLGATFNYGLLVAVAHAGILSLSILSLFLSLLVWTVFYDTIYAFADLKDDLKIGVKSTAIIMQKAPKICLTCCNVLIHGLILGFLQSYGWISIILVCMGFIYLQMILIRWRVTDPQNCIKTFNNCHFWGLGLWVGLEFIRIIAP